MYSGKTHYVIAKKGLKSLMLHKGQQKYQLLLKLLEFTNPMDPKTDYYSIGQQVKVWLEENRF